MKRQPAQEVDLVHFSSIAWCSAVLCNPSYTIYHTESRTPQPDSNEDALFSTILNTPDTISHCLTLVKKSPTNPAGSGDDGVDLIPECRTLLQLGVKLNSHPRIAHGGAQALILDEAMAQLLSFQKDAIEAREGARPVTVTKWIRCEFVRPVATPGAAMVVARFKGVEGRRFEMEAELVDGEGNVLTRGEALFVRVREAAAAALM